MKLFDPSYFFKTLPKRLWGSFSARVFLCLMVTIFFLIVFIEVFFIYSQRGIIADYMIKEGRTMSMLLADSIKLGVFSENMEMVAMPVSAILRQNKVLEVLVFDKSGKMLLDRKSDTNKGDKSCLASLAPNLGNLFSEVRRKRSVIHHTDTDCLFFMAPVLTSVIDGGEGMFFDSENGGKESEKLLGFVTVTFDRQSLVEQQSQMLAGNILLGVLSLLFAAIATYLIVIAATRPLNRLVRDVRKSETGLEAVDEIGLLHESFSVMVERLSTSFSTINRLKKELEEMTREVLRTQEQERQRLALDLHDNVAQELSALKIFCSGLLKDCSAASEPAVTRLEFISNSLKKCIETVRELSYDLRPPGLSQLGLAQTVTQLCEEFRIASGVDVDLMVIGFEDVDPEYNIAINCYRIIQEALSNVKKHAKSEMVQVRLIESFPKIIIRVRDYGVGFDVASRSAEVISERRMGVRNMEKRAMLLSGTMTIESQLGRGTMIIVELPYKEDG